MLRIGRIRRLRAASGQLVVALFCAMSLLLSLDLRAERPLRLDPSKAMTQYVSDSWRETTGLPVDSVATIAQTPDGYLWLGTEVGLVRFDGVRFTVFSTATTSAFMADQIECLFTSSDGTLWIGTRGGGALTWDGNAFRRVATPLRFVIGIAESGDGAVWLGAPSGVARISNGRTQIFGKKHGYPGGRLVAVAADQSGLFLAMPPGVLRIDERGVQTWTTAEGLSPGFVTSLLTTSSGVLAATENGAVDRLVGDPSTGAARFENLLRTRAGNPISSMIEGDRGSLWLATAGGGILRYADGSVAQLTERDGLTSNSVNRLLEDDEGNVWAATTGGGLVRLKEGRIRTVVPRQALNGEWILQLIEARDGSVWFTTNGGGLNHLRDGSLTRLTAADGLRSNVISALAEGRDGAIWVASDDALQRIEDHRVVQTITPKDGLSGPQIFALMPARDGSLWVSTSKGLHRILDGVVRKLSDLDGFVAVPVVAMRESRDGALWFAKPAGIERFADGKLTTYGRDDGLRTNNIHSIAIDEKDGAIWVATGDDGVARIRNGRVSVYRAADGLLSDTAYGVVQDRAGNPWISTNRGLYTIKRADLDRFDSRQIRRIPITVFRTADGLKTSDFSGGFDQPGFRASDGTLWFATTRGLAVVDPERIRVDTNPPRVMIESVVANGLPIAPGTAIDVPHGKRQIEIAYTSPTFYSPETTSFRYLLEGFDERWQEAGTRRTAYYTNVPPGTYRFRVQAINATGLVRETVRTIRILPQIHETWMFRTLIALVLLLIALVVLRRRNEAVRQRQEELRQSEEHFRSLTEYGSDMILVVDSRGTITYVSPSLPRLLGWDAESLTGGRLADVVPDSDAFSEFLNAVESCGRASATLQMLDTSGQRHDIESIGTSYGSYGRIILNCRDVTERRRLEQQLQQANRVASLGRLAATVSHEFNNVLMGIQPFVELLKRRSTDPAVQQATVHMTQSVNRGKRITEEILRYTRPVEPSLRPVGVREWLRSLETEIRALVGPAVRVTISAPAGLTINADVAQLAQVLTNMAINARDAGATAIRISAVPSEGNGVFPFGRVRDPHRFAHLRLTDNGSGIPDAILPHIFEPLFTTKTTRGTGLGLAVAQKVVSGHGGEMFVESRVGTGTTFHLFLPLGIAAAVDPTSVPPAQSSGAATCRLLLVEDTSEVAEGILAMLEEEGFDVHLAISGDDALGVIPSLAPDVVILDIGLPDMSGVELHRRIAERWPAIGTIFSTGHGDVLELEEDADAAPICLLKPYGRDELLAAIAETLERRNQAVA